MNDITAIRIVGVGGIGSYLCRSLHAAILQNQLNPKLQIHVYDHDQVESKNIRYQCFDDLDIASYKVDAMEEKYGFIPHAEEVNEIMLKKWNKENMVISCVDNRQFRQELFTYCAQENTPHFIDLRSEGRFIAYYTKSKANTLEKLLSSVSSDSRSTGSCEIPYRFANNVVDWGTKIIAEIGVQLILNYVRDETYNSHLLIKL